MSDQVTLDDFERFLKECPNHYDERELDFLNTMQDELKRCMDKLETEGEKKACFRGFLMAMREVRELL